MVSSSFKQMWNVPYTKLFIIELCFQMGMQTVQPITSNAALALGATVTLAGILAGVCSAVSLVLRIVCGRISARIPLKTMLVAASIIFFLSSLAVALFGNIAVLGVTRLLYGVAIVFKSLLVVAICVRVAPRECMGQAVAWIGMENTFAIAVGPQIAQYLGLNFGYSYAFVFSTVMFAISIAVSITYPHLPLLNSTETDEEEAHELSRGRQKRGLAALLKSLFYFDAIPVALIGVFEATIFGIVNMLTLTVGDLRGMPETSFFFVSYVIVSFASRPFLSKLYDKHGFAKVCLPMCVSMTLCMVGFIFTNNLPMVILDGVLFALGQGCLWPCLQAESVKDVPVEKSSLAANTFLLGIDIGITAGPMVGGAILDAAGPTGLYIFATVVGVVMILWVIRCIKR